MSGTRASGSVPRSATGSRVGGRSPTRLPFVTVVVPALNGESTLADCLTALLHTDYPADRREIVVVDNGSTDRSPEIARGFPVRWLREERRGRSHARNRGIRESRGEIVALLDCDCFATAGWLGSLVDGFSDPDVHAVSGEVVALRPGTPAERYAARRKPYWQEWVARARPFAWLLSGNCALRRETFRRVGLFDPRFTTAACEDIDFAWRFQRAGLTARRQPEALAFHRHRLTSRGLFRQHYGYGRGQVLLRQKYPGELPWGPRRELAAWWDLARSGWRAAGAVVRRRGPTRETNLQFPWLDLVRKSGQRLGFVRESVRWGRRGDRPFQNPENPELVPSLPSDRQPVA